MDRLQVEPSDSLVVDSMLVEPTSRALCLGHFCDDARDSSAGDYRNCIKYYLFFVLFVFF
jgi:hypothetical protein